MSIEIAAMDPLGPPFCLLCGERFDAEGYSPRFKPELLPGVPVSGFAPVLLVEDRPVGFVCPGCFGRSAGAGDLARSMERGAEHLRRLARELGT